MSLTRLTLIAAAILGLSATAASAQGGYGGLSAFDWEVDRDGISTIESTGVRATGGYMFSDFVGIETHVGVGGTDELQFPGGMNPPEEAKAELNKLLGVFAKANLPLPVPLIDANVFGLAGYSYGKIEVLAETTTATVSEDSFSWGAGAEVALIPDRLYLTADYVKYISASDLDASAMSLGLRLSFSQ